jgi:hypothetical protein
MDVGIAPWALQQLPPRCLHNLHPPSTPTEQADLPARGPPAQGGRGTPPTATTLSPRLPESSEPPQSHGADPGLEPDLLRVPVTAG